MFDDNLENKCTKSYSGCGFIKLWVRRSPVCLAMCLAYERHSIQHGVVQVSARGLPEGRILNARREDTTDSILPSSVLLVFVA